MTKAVNKTWKYYDVYLRTQKKKNSCSKFTKASLQTVQPRRPEIVHSMKGSLVSLSSGLWVKW